MSKDNSFSAFIFGLTAGVVAGFLLAPKSGEETRKDIKKLAENAVDKAEDTYLKAQKLVKTKEKALKRAGKKIDKKKYSDLINEVVQELREDGEVTGDVAREIGMQLRSDFDMVKTELTK